MGERGSWRRRCLAPPPFEVGGTSNSPRNRSPGRRRSFVPGGRGRIAKRIVRRCDREKGRIRRRSRGSPWGLPAGSPPGLSGATLEDAPRVRNAMREDERASSACGGPSPIGSPSLGGGRCRGRSVLCTSEPDIEMARRDPCGVPSLREWHRMNAWLPAIFGGLPRPAHEALQTETPTS